MKKNLKKISLILIMALLISTIGSTGIFAEDLPEEEIVDITNVQVSDNSDIEVSIDEDEGDVLGGSGAAMGRYIDGTKDWAHQEPIHHRYIDLNKGDKVEVTPQMDPDYNFETSQFEYHVKHYTTAYDTVSDCVYGIMSIPAYDNGGLATALVRIPNTKSVELDKKYDAEFMFDVERLLGHGWADGYSIQILNGRIYLFVTQNYILISPESGTNDLDGSPLANDTSIFLLYSTDMNGEDLKLHMREAYSYYDSTSGKRPCWICYSEHPRAIQFINGSWYAIVHDPNSRKVKLPDGMISSSGINGFMSPTDEWLTLEKRYGKDYIEKGTPASDPNVTVTTYEQLMYIRQWLYDNGYTQHLYLTTYKEAEEERKEEYKERDKQIASGDCEAVSANKIFIVKDKIDINNYLGKATGKVRYISSNKKIASAKKSGIITAKKPGKVTITRQVKDGKLWINQSALEIEICKPETTLTKNTLEIKAGSNATYNIADYIVSKANVVPTYTISNSGMAVIGGDATKITPLTTGKATITAKFNNYKLKIKVIVTP